MDALAHWAAMGGYAAFVWPAYAIAAAVLGGIAVQSRWRHRASAVALDQVQRQVGSQE
jgi:heme exporter protein CcmD